MAKVQPSEAEQRLQEAVQEANGTKKDLEKLLKDIDGKTRGIQKDLLGESTSDLIQEAVAKALEPIMEGLRKDLLHYVKVTEETIKERINLSTETHRNFLARKIVEAQASGVDIFSIDFKNL